jgi:hypothetical protein
MTAGGGAVAQLLRQDPKNVISPSSRRTAPMTSQGTHDRAVLVDRAVQTEESRWTDLISRLEQLLKK